VDRVLAGGTAEASNTSLEAQADLLAACLAHQADPAAACGAALLRLAGIEPAVAGAVSCSAFLFQLQPLPLPRLAVSRACDLRTASGLQCRQGFR
jgi:hypothetical protein